MESNQETRHAQIMAEAESAFMMLQMQEAGEREETDEEQQARRARTEQILRAEIVHLRQDFINCNYDEEHNNQITEVLSGALDDYIISCHMNED